jgi:hypothetical protein
MIVALDFDDTYNLDPEFWSSFIDLAENKGHQVILATYRHETLDWDPLMEDLGKRIQMFFTDGKAKRPFLKDLGLEVDIWIDDNPFSITQDSAWKHDSPELHAWREANKEKA